MQPLIRNVLAELEKVDQPQGVFDPGVSDRTFRVMASDYGESTSLPAVLGKLREQPRCHA
ncbi:MAG: hypothetical protein R3E74_03275 [Pseudomonadales bacterium]